jgi:hypothetical protein
MELTDKTKFLRSTIIDFTNRISDELTLLSIAKIALYEIVDPALHFKKSFPELEGKIDKFEEIIRKDNDDKFKSKELIDFIREESVNNFGSFFKPYSILIWTHLETFIKNFIVAWIKTNSQSLEIPIVKATYEKLQNYEDEEEKYHALIDNLELRVRSPNSFGIKKFENILRIFSLDGEVDKDIQNALLELQQVRNLLVHRRGIVDKKILDICNWVVSYGKEVFIDQEIFEWYIESSFKYAILVTDRAIKKMADESHHLH